jgi:hypothetical protein
MADRSMVRMAATPALGSKLAAAVSMPVPAGPRPSPVPVVPAVVLVPMPVPVVPVPGVKVPGVPPIVPPVIGVIVPIVLYKEGNAVSILVKSIRVHAEFLPNTIICQLCLLCC